MVMPLRSVDLYLRSVGTECLDEFALSFLSGHNPINSVCPQSSPSRGKTYQLNGELNRTLSGADTHQQIMFVVIFKWR